MDWTTLFGYSSPTLLSSEDEVSELVSEDEVSEKNHALTSILLERDIWCIGCGKYFLNHPTRTKHFKECSWYAKLSVDGKYICCWCNGHFNTERGRNVHVHKCAKIPGHSADDFALDTTETCVSVSECLGCGIRILNSRLNCHTKRCKLYQALTVNGKHKCRYCNKLFDRKVVRARHYAGCKKQHIGC